MHRDDPASLYIVTQPNDKARLRPLVRIMVNMIDAPAGRQDGLRERPAGRALQTPPADDAGRVPERKLEILQESLAFVAGYGIKCYLICQDINQLKSRETGYGHDETITSNCHARTPIRPTVSRLPNTFRG